MNENLFFGINIIVFVFCFSMTMYIVFKYAYLRLKVSELNYFVYKPLFPFELNANDPFHIDMLHKELLVNSESN